MVIYVQSKNTNCHELSINFFRPIRSIVLQEHVFLTYRYAVIYQINQMPSGWVTPAIHYSKINTSVPLKFGIMFLSILGAIKALKSMLFICKWLILKMDDHSNRRALFLLIRY